jgi:quinol monooxygenase YgiN
MAFVVIAKWTAREGEEDAVAGAVEAMVEPSRAEPGVILYQPHRDPEDPKVFLLYEQYVDEAAYKAHGESAHFQRFGFEEGIPRLESRERSFFETFEP